MDMFQFDLPAFILFRLQQSGVGNALNLDRCTYGEEDMFFSYRRTTHRNEPDYGPSDFGDYNRLINSIRADLEPAKQGASHGATLFNGMNMQAARPLFWRKWLIANWTPC